MKLTKVVDMIRGKKGTKVKLKVLVPKEENEEESAGIERRTRIYELTRTEVKITEDEVKGKILETSEWIDGRKAKVGILRIPAFYRDFRGASQGGNFKSTARDVKVVLDEFTSRTFRF